MAPGAHLFLSGDKKILVFSYKSYVGTIDCTGSETWLGSKKKTHNQRMVTLQTVQNKRVRENWKIVCQYPYKNKS